jgi:uncharacterized membrane protein
MKQTSPPPTAVLQALLVTFLWATSWVLIKIGLDEIPALTFAGLRYSLAFLILVIPVLLTGRARRLKRISRRMWAQLIVLGLLFYTVTQGAMFLGLAYLPAVTVNLVLSLTSLIVALFGVPLLGELPTVRQWVGIGIALFGVFLFFYPIEIPGGQAIGYASCEYGGGGYGTAPDRDRHPGVPSHRIDVLGDYRLAGTGQYCLCLHALESHTAIAFCDGIEHHQQYHVDTDPHPCRDISWRENRREGRYRPWAGRAGDAISAVAEAQSR